MACDNRLPGRYPKSALCGIFVGLTIAVVGLLVILSIVARHPHPVHY